MNWQAFKIFVETARLGSLSAASQSLDLSVATISRKISALESELGHILMTRGRHGITLTSMGQNLLTQSMSAVESLQTIESQLKTNASKNVFSPVRLSATEPVIADILAPKLGQLPAPISLDLVATTQPADLARMDADLAIRMFRPYSDELVIRKIGSLELSWFASEEYLGGRDPSAIDLNKEDLLTYSPVYGDISEVAWIKTANLENQVRHTSTSSRALFIAAKHGLGIALGSRLVYDAQDLIELPLETPPPRDLWLAYHHSNRNSKRLKAVRDWLAAAVFQD